MPYPQPVRAKYFLSTVIVSICWTTLLDESDHCRGQFDRIGQNVGANIGRTDVFAKDCGNGHRFATTPTSPIASNKMNGRIKLESSVVHSGYALAIIGEASEISNLKFVIRAQRRGGLAITENRKPAKRLKSQVSNSQSHQLPHRQGCDY